eukprot:TRINITY_DN60722_c0_g1_i1.p1 TRINITY_DN60722_c0_g1~~TRINITY_DN60722_c0_g1_i1.p1  ORF type:complete len:437 (+),score=55.30 TRINITY_DN60722_c0_g1_i1:140-1450(+)
MLLFAFPCCDDNATPDSAVVVAEQAAEHSAVPVKSADSTPSKKDVLPTPQELHESPGSCPTSAITLTAGTGSSEDKQSSILVTDAMIEESIEQVSTEIRGWNWNDFSFKKLIQKAPCNHGDVLLVYSKGGEKIAAKRMPNSWVRGGYSSFKKTYRTSENPWYDMAILRLLNKLNFAYVCRFLGVYRDLQDTYVCAEFATRGDLFVWCNETSLKCSPTREKLIQPMVAQLVRAVMVLHNMGIAHRDISIENILLTDCPDGSTKVLLVDFGMAIASRECSGNSFGKKTYRAPELHTPQVLYDMFLVDDFALGVVLYCWVVSDLPWVSTNDECRLFRFFRDRGLAAFLQRRKCRRGTGYLMDNISLEVVEVLEGLLRCNPQERSCVGESSYTEAPLKHSSVWNKPWLLKLAPDKVTVPTAQGVYNQHKSSGHEEFRTFV